MPLSGLLAEYGFHGGWPSIFYVFGLVGVIWSVAFLFLVYEDPSSHPRIEEKEKKYIISSLYGTANITVIDIPHLHYRQRMDVFRFTFIICIIRFAKQSPPVPYKSIITSLPFYAILFAHMGQNFGYETLMTELPTYMKQVLRFSIKEVSFEETSTWICAFRKQCEKLHF